MSYWLHIFHVISCDNIIRLSAGITSPTRTWKKKFWRGHWKCHYFTETLDQYYVYWSIPSLTLPPLDYKFEGLIRLKQQEVSFFWCHTVANRHILFKIKEYSSEYKKNVKIAVRWTLVTFFFTNCRVVRKLIMFISLNYDLDVWNYKLLMIHTQLTISSAPA